MAGSGCGSHKHYQAGCPACRRITSAYKRKREAAIANGTWQHPVPVDVVLAHIDALRRAGMTVVGIARVADLPDSTVQTIVNESPKTVTGPVAAALLAVQPQRTDRAGQVSAVGAKRRVQAMVAGGYTLTEISVRLGKRLQQVWALARGRLTAVSVETDRRVVALFDELLLRPGGSVRARRMAERHGWLPAEAWSNIDDPDAKPYDGVDFVDMVRVDKALAGERVQLTSLERHHAVHVGAGRGMSFTALAGRLHISHATAQTLAAEPLPAGYELVA
ncbi:hypothetical protein [Plantactinospora sp. WMMB782]|uniref:hypothetical protein n=1 Tax=Plantactinospora sp. WMMB782 TaxID=3404121 RepID=UPI003B92B710